MESVPVDAIAKVPLVVCRRTEGRLKENRFLTQGLVLIVGISIGLFAEFSPLLRTAFFLLTSFLLWLIHRRMTRQARFGYFIRIFEDRMEVANGGPSHWVAYRDVVWIREYEEEVLLRLRNDERISLPYGPDFNAAYEFVRGKVETDLPRRLWS